MLNQGKELYHNPDIQNYCTGSDALNQNGQFEKSCCTISNSICALFFGS